eukprot:813374-Prymnesium_polylepis.1
MELFSNTSDEPSPVDEIQLDAHHEPSALDDCPVCLQVLFQPVALVPCGHTYCEKCWRRVTDAAAYDDREATCPVCRSVCESAALDAALDDAVRQRRTE